MSETGWATLLEVNTRLEAEIIKEALEAEGMPAEIIQEAVRSLYPGVLASVEICVPKERLVEARAWLVDYETGNLGGELPGRIKWCRNPRVQTSVGVNQCAT